MRILAGLFVIAMCASGGVSQEHAPSVEVCRADIAVWYSADLTNQYTAAQIALVNNEVPNRTETNKLPIKELLARLQEMAQCGSVDEGAISKYYDAMSFYHTVIADRYYRFVYRHHLKDQLEREDAQGIR
jgi:hypothetical protein